MGQDTEPVRSFHAGRVAAGVIVLGLGILMWVDRAGPFDIQAGQLFAPFVLIALGLARMADTWICARRARHPFTGAWLILIGLWMLASTLHVWGLTYQTSWPLLIVAFGIMMVAREFVGPRGGDDRPVRRDG